MWQNWQGSEQTLLKKREAITRVSYFISCSYQYVCSFKQPVELKKFPVQSSKSKVIFELAWAEFEPIIDWESRVQSNRKAFEEMSATAKSEINIWEQERVRDTRAFMTKWMKAMLEAEKKIVKMWEQYLPKPQ